MDTTGFQRQSKWSTMVYSKPACERVSQRLNDAFEPTLEKQEVRRVIQELRPGSMDQLTHQKVILGHIEVQVADQPALQKTRGGQHNIVPPGLAR